MFTSKMKHLRLISIKDFNKYFLINEKLKLCDIILFTWIKINFDAKQNKHVTKNINRLENKNQLSNKLT